MSAGEGGKGAKRRSGIPMRAAAVTTMTTMTTTTTTTTMTTTSAASTATTPTTPTTTMMPTTTTTTTTTRRSSESRRMSEPAQRLHDEGKDSGLSSSECSTPVNASPPPRQVQAQLPRRPKMRDIIAASKARLQESERLNNNRTARLLQSRSSTDSPRSLDGTRGRPLFSPLRTPRNVQSPSLDSGDEGSLRLERGTYNYMFQDIVSIKTMLLKLKRVLQESGENGLTRSDTLNPFENSLKNGLFYNLNDGIATTDPNDGRELLMDEVADLRRQVVYLQGQIEDKDRAIQTLQSQLSKYQGPNGARLASEASSSLNGNGEPRETTNSATQTEKLRPVSAGPSILHGLTQDNGMGSVVSWNESWSNSQQKAWAHRPESGSSSAASSNASIASRASSRRSSSDTQHQLRPSSIRGLRPPEPPRSRAPRTPKTPEEPSESMAPTRSAIPTARRLLAPTLIPRPARAQSQERPGVQLL